MKILIKRIMIIKIIKKHKLIKIANNIRNDRIVDPRYEENRGNVISLRDFFSHRYHRNPLSSILFDTLFLCSSLRPMRRIYA